MFTGYYNKYPSKIRDCMQSFEKKKKKDIQTQNAESQSIYSKCKNTAVSREYTGHSNTSSYFAF